MTRLHRLVPVTNKIRLSRADAKSCIFKGTLIQNKASHVKVFYLPLRVGRDD